MAAIIVLAKEVLSGGNVVHDCFQWILTLYGVLINNPMGVVATLLGILRNPRWLPIHWNGYNFLPIRHIWFIFSSIGRNLNSAKLWHHQKIQYGRQHGCRSEYYSDSVHSYPREIILVSTPRFSRLLNTLEQLLLRLYGYIIVKFKVKGVQVLDRFSLNASLVGGSYFSFERILAPFRPGVIPILCSGLKTLCRMDRTSVHNMHR